MHGNSGRGLRRARPAAIVMAMSSVALLAAACGNGSSSSTAAETSQYTKALAYAQCMRSHGVTSFPDPDSQGHFPTVQVGHSVTQQMVQSAEDACRHLNPGGGTSPQQQQADLTQALNFAKCMRQHGVTNFPDPVTSNGGIGYNLTGINVHSSQYQSAQQVCQAQNPRRGGS